MRPTLIKYTLICINLQKVRLNVGSKVLFDFVVILEGYIYIYMCVYILDFCFYLYINQNIVNRQKTNTFSRFYEYKSV